MNPRFAVLLRCTALFLLSGCTVELQHDLAEDDANDIYVLLQHRGIDVKKAKDPESGNEPRYIIAVAKADVADAAQALREYALPRPRADGLSVFKKNKGLIPTATEERAMFIEALAGEVSNSLNRIGGVLEARTIVMIPEVNDLTQPEKKPKPSASVFIKYRPVSIAPGEEKLPIEEKQVKEFVAKSVPEMTPDQVTVLFTKQLDSSKEYGERQQIVLGLTMTQASADKFKLMVGGAALLILLMAAFAVFAFVRWQQASAQAASE